MREPVITIDPPHVRGQIRGVSDWTQLVPRTRADAQRIKTEQIARAKRDAAASEQERAARLAEVRKIATWPRHATSGPTPRTTTRVVPRRTETGGRLDTRANAQASATPTPPAPARPRSFRDIAHAVYGEAPTSGAALVPSSARGGR